MSLYSDTGVVTTPTTNVEKGKVDTASVYKNRDTTTPVILSIEGSVWSVNYFGQFINSSDIVANSEDISSRVLKQYQRIHNFELRVESELSHSGDSGSGLSVLTGSSNVYPVLVPIVGDVFIGEIDSGNNAVFEVIGVSRQSLYKESAWLIEYTMISYLDKYNLESIKSKVVLNLIFDPSLIGAPTGPLVTISENDRNISKDEMIEDLVTIFYNSFYSERFSSILMPTDGTKTYDPFIVEFWNRIIPNVYTKDVPIPKEFDIKTSIFRRGFTTVFDAIREQSNSLLLRVVKEMGILPVEAFGNSYIYHSLSSSSLDKVVHPNTVGKESVGATSVELYIFSDNFYNGITKDMTPIELLTYNLINKKSIDHKDVNEIYDNFGAFTDIQKFYYIPILITLLIEGK